VHPRFVAKRCYPLKREISIEPAAGEFRGAHNFINSDTVEAFAAEEQACLFQNSGAGLGLMV